MKLIEKILIGLCVLLPVFAYVFRKTLYLQLPVEPGNPYGIGDVIELLIWFSFVGVALVIFLVGVARALVPKLRNLKYATFHIVLSMLSLLFAVARVNNFSF